MTNYPGFMPWHVLLTLSVLVICGRISAVQAAPDPMVGPLSTARLIAAPAPSDGSWTIGVAIVLKPKAITYWRDPGEAGVPPAFDFSASSNVSRADVAYPVPKQLHEGDIDAIGYENEVVFPVRVTPADAAQATTVRLKLDYATCERICMPAHADLVLALPPPAQAVEADRISQAAAAVPRIIDLTELPRVVTVVAQKGDDGPSWIITPREASPDTRLFVEAPEGFFLTTKRDGDRFLVTVAEHPPGRTVPQTLRLTLAQPGTAIDVTIPTD